MAAPRKRVLLSVVAPVYNNAPHLVALVGEIRRATTGIPCEIVFINDGSPDNSWDIIGDLKKSNTKSLSVRGVKLSRNFGQHAAIYAGLRHARGDMVVVLDADLQDDPAFIPALVEKARSGFDVVHTKRVGQRRTFRRILSEIVYRILTFGSEIRLHTSMGNYKLVSRRAVEVMLAYREWPPLFELMAERVGFPSAAVEIRRRERSVDVSAYRLADSFRFIAGLLFAYSSLLFRCFVVIGAFFWLFGLAGLVSALVLGSGSTAVILWSFCAQSGLVLLVGGIVGLYVRSAQRAARGWPIFTVDKEI